jgi:hypothetical protein
MTTLAFRKAHGVGTVLTRLPVLAGNLPWRVKVVGHTVRQGLECMEVKVLEAGTPYAEHKDGVHFFLPIRGGEQLYAPRPV